MFFLRHFLDTFQSPPARPQSGLSRNAQTLSLLRMRGLPASYVGVPLG
jgi:hypothetical protein